MIFLTTSRDREGAGAFPRFLTVAARQDRAGRMVGLEVGKIGKSFPNSIELGLRRT
jgi:hypothetical protein